MKKYIVTTLLVLFALSCSKDKENVYRKSSAVMDTVATITVVAGSEGRAERAIDAAFAEIRRLEGLLSFWSGDSEIALINRSAGRSAVRVSKETLDIASKALLISDRTGGAFDPTIGPVIKKWDFRNRSLPDEKGLEEALRLVDYRKVVVDGEEETVYLEDERMSFDTGGIAKGFAADAAVRVLKEMGIKGGLVSVSGDIRAFGRKPSGDGGRPWRVGIRDPRSDDREAIVAYLELDEEAVSTSGDYERYIVLDGVRYHHILNPKTGRPAMGCESVTVLAREAVLTDGFSTGVFVMGPDKGIEFLEDDPLLEGLIIATDGSRLVTSGLRDRVVWVKENDANR